MTRELWTFFGLAYALTWVFTIPLAVLWNTTFEQSFSPWILVFLPAPFGPTFAALYLTRRRDGPGAAKALLHKLIEFRAPIRWYAFALLAPFLIVALATSLSDYRFALAEFDVLRTLAFAPGAMLLALPFGPLPEELGWRGYAQPRLVESGLWKSSLIIGTAWTFWHVPMFWFPGAAIPSFLDLGPVPVGLYWAQITAEAALMTGLYVASRGSVVLAVLYHTTFNTAETVVFETLPEATAAQEFQVYVLSIALSWALAVWLLTRVSARSGARTRSTS